MRKMCMDIGQPALPNKKLRNKKVPGSPENSKVKAFDSPPPKSKPGTNKPLSTSFHLDTTAKTRNSYANPSLACQKLGKKKKISFNLAVITLVSLAVSLLPMQFLGLNDDHILTAKAWETRLAIWSPKDQEVMAGTGTFKAALDYWNIGDYKMFWRVDGGQLNEMSNIFTDAPHKEASVDFSGWTWRGDGPYVLTFSAFGNNGQKISEAVESIYVGSMLSSSFVSGQVPILPMIAPACPLIANGSPSGGFVGCYYSDRNLNNPVLSRTDSGVSFDWGLGSPDSRVPADNFSARWQGNFTFNGGNYEFITTADDGVRVYVDNNLIINQWIDQPPTTHRANIPLSAGTHLIKMEYYERGGGAVAKLSWEQANGNTSASVNSSCPSPSTNAFTGCYYSDRNLSNAVLTRTDNSINFAWGSNSPDSRVPSDNFSARWQGNYSFNSGDYTFTVTADDGVRLYLDNQLILDKWLDQAPTTYTVTKALSAGTHLIKLEYYENGGGATAKLSWQQNQATPPTGGGTGGTVSASSNPFAGMKLYLNPNSNAARQANTWRNSRPQDAQMMDKIAGQPNSVWFGSWNQDIISDVNNLVSAAASQGALPVMIAYNIPNRDCGGYSAGGAQTTDAYKSWINAFAAGIGNRKAVVILEPDALTLTNCLSQAEQQNRNDLLKYAISVFKDLGQTAVYLDAGHAKWLAVDDVANKLSAAGVNQANGFALNTSNFVTTQDNLAYGRQISGKTGGRHFVIDTSRNGLGPTPDMQWCNPQGRALGNRPTASTGDALADAFIWGKQPGESDGQCNGGPAAGVWWPEYALGLAQRAAW